MKLVIGLIIVIGVLIALRSIAQSKGLTVSELIRSWLPTAPTDLEEGEEPLTTGAPLNPTLIDRWFAHI
ncbi:hypothetical protein ES703_19867 [subsurface metagenome]